MAKNQPAPHTEPPEVKFRRPASGAKALKVLFFFFFFDALKAPKKVSKWPKNQPAPQTEPPEVK